MVRFRSNRKHVDFYGRHAQGPDVWSIAARIGKPLPTVLRDMGKHRVEL